MKTRLPSVEKIGIISGLLTGLALAAYFLIMELLGFSHILELRFFNFIILAAGVCVAINKYKHDLHEKEFYLQGWAQGIYTSVVAVVSFGLFMSFYLSYFNPELMLYIQEHAVAGQHHINGLSIFFAILMEGMAGGFVITLAAMQYFKSVGNPKREPSTLD